MAELHIHGAADADYVEGFVWYCERDPANAERFEAAFQEALVRIRDDPEWWAVYDQAHRFVRVKGFPYHVIFRPSERDIWVVAVAHDSRDPDYWRGR
jgi:toxin ParE1/3/4